MTVTRSKTCLRLDSFFLWWWYFFQTTEVSRTRQNESSVFSNITTQLSVKVTEIQREEGRRETNVFSAEEREENLTCIKESAL